MLNKKQVIIIELLSSEYRWWYSLEFIKASNGKLPRGTVFIDLSKMIDEGLIDCRMENLREIHIRRSSRGGPSRMFLYRINDVGMKTLREHREMVESRKKNKWSFFSFLRWGK